MVKCPQCGSDEFFFVTRDYSYAKIENYDPEGPINLEEVSDTVSDENYNTTVECTACEWTGTLDEYEIVLKEKKANGE